jgi:cyclopropane fatty-acyl-phospholipid synthase-like methyltransferase
MGFFQRRDALRWHELFSQSVTELAACVKWGHAGCKVLGITISKEQLVEAQARVQAAGL